MKLSKNDFIEIDFVAKTSNGEIFDTNTAEGLRESNLKGDAKPHLYPLGQDFFLKGVDDFLLKQEIKKFPVEFTIELDAENAFGKRNSKLVSMIPIKSFVQHKINPVPGAVMNFDGKYGKILTVSGGRVLVDFNNLMAGKDVIYEIKIKRKVEDLDEKIKSLNEFFFKKNFDFEVKNKKIIFKASSEMKRVIEMFKDKYKNILNLDIEVE